MAMTGWICPNCGAGVAPTVKEHCTKTPTVTTPGTNPAYPYPYYSQCAVCGYYYSGGSHACPGRRTMQPYPYITWGNDSNSNWTNIPPNQPVDNLDDEDPPASRV